MARPAKIKVDYFPHVTHTGKSIAILETRWGNDGYAFWFKLLELLGDSDDFAYNCNQSAAWEYLLAKTRVTDPVALAILSKLAEIGAIDAELWGEKWVWSDNFVAGVAPAFEKRKGELPQKPDFRSRNHGDSRVSVTGSEVLGGAAAIAGPETGKGEERKGEDIKGEDIKGEERNGEERNGEERNGEETNGEAEHPCPSKLRDGVEPQADTVYLKPAEVDRLTLETDAAGYPVRGGPGGGDQSMPFVAVFLERGRSRRGGPRAGSMPGTPADGGGSVGGSQPAHPGRGSVPRAAV